MNKSKTPYSLNQQIQQLQQQMADEQVILQKQRIKVRELLVERLTSWPVLLGAVAAGLLLSQTRRHDSATQSVSQSTTQSTTDSTSAAPNHTTVATPSSGELTPAQIAAAAAEPAAPSCWNTLLSLPLLTQGIWWLAEQIWYSRLFRDVLRQKLLKSEERRPPY
jgi:hypothetical protein